MPRIGMVHGGVQVDRKGIGTIEIIIIVVALSAAVVGAAIAVYHFTAVAPSPIPGEGYPAVDVIAWADNENIKITVTSGEIPAGDWDYSISTIYESYSWSSGTEALDPPYVSLGTYPADNYYISLRHKPSGYIFYSGVIDVVY